MCQFLKVLNQSLEHSTYNCCFHSPRFGISTTARNRTEKLHLCFARLMTRSMHCGCWKIALEVWWWWWRWWRWWRWRWRWRTNQIQLACWFFSFLFGPGHMEPASSAQLGHCFQVLSWPSVVLLAARGTCYVTGWARASAVMDWFPGSYYTSINKSMSLSVHIPSFFSQNLKHETDVDIIAGSQWLIPQLEVIALCKKLEDCWGQKYCIAELTKLTVCLGEQNPSFLAYFPWTNPSVYPMCFSRRDLSSPTCGFVAVVGIVVICGLQ